MIRKLSATGPTANTVSLNALHCPALRARVFTRALCDNVTMPAYRRADGDVLPPPPEAPPLPAIRAAEIKKSELVVERLSPWMARMLVPGRSASLAPTRVMFSRLTASPSECWSLAAEFQAGSVSYTHLRAHET